jgi:glycosyltransferase involved in cell wall biosynthesis
MQPRRLVILAYHFPPESAVGAARPFRFFKYLPQFGYSPHVITASPPAGPGAPEVECIPDRVGELWERRREERGRLPMAAQVERVLRKYCFPAAVGLAWSGPAARAARAVVDQHRHIPVALLSTYPPLGVHLAAWRVVCRRRVPWVADFRDPITVGQLRHLLSGPQRAAYAFLENGVFRQARAVIVNTDETAEAYRKAYPFAARKIHVIPNGFDPGDRLSALPIPARAYRLLVHAGALYGGRNPNLILESLARLRAVQDRGACRTRVLLVGEVGGVAGLAEPLMNTAAQEGWLEFIPRRVPQEEAHRIMQQADGLLLLQPQAALEVPAKLFECLSIGRPILALVPRHSAVEAILSQAGIPFCCVHPDETPGAVDAKISAFLHLPSTPVEASPWFQERFNAVAQTRQLAELLDQL